MSNSPQSAAVSDLKVTGKELAGFIAERSKGLDCPICKTEDAPLVHADGADSLAHVMTSRITLPIDRGFNVDFKTTCANCGYSWYFDAGVVTRWVEKNRGKEEANNGKE